ncbi:NFX1-type zinc finger-containing protein 1 [Mixophyes fleayi]|uniref:NFX1-type zinc finger-containing protein 1 n=1 Tax=Mixophyes fleayi TaxID=3061075 RepID=UPI003F4E095A
MDREGRPREEPQNIPYRPNQRSRTGSRHRREPNNDQRQIQHQQQERMNEGGRLELGAGQPELRAGGRPAQQAGGRREQRGGVQHAQRGGGRHDHGAGRHFGQEGGGQHAQRGGGRQEHGAGRHFGQEGRGQHAQRGGGRHEHGAGRPFEQEDGGQHAQRGGGHHEHGAGQHYGQEGGGQHAQRGGGRHEHVAGRHYGQEGGGQHVHGAGGRNEQRGGRHHERGPGPQNEQRAGGQQVNNQRRENHNQRGRQDGEVEHKVRRLGYKALEELLEKDPSEVVITLAAHSGLSDLLSATEMRPDFVELLCKAVCRACTSKLDRQSIQHLLGLIKSSMYLRTCLPRYIVGMMTEVVPERRYRYPDHISNILCLLQELISLFPASSLQETSLLVSLIPGSINALRASGIDVREDIEQSLERLSNFLQHLQDRRREGTLRVDTHMVLGPEVPAQDFRTMSVYPNHDEIHLNESPFLRPNTQMHKYESTGLYLDTHFRLLREDFVRPLKNGIQDILQLYDDKRFRKMKFDDIRIYFDTRVLTPMCTSSGIIYKVQFDITPLKMIRWQNSKRLLYGSLVCLSKDNFETFLFATVSNRDEKELEQGEVQLQFSEQSRGLLARTRPTDSFMMVETTAYFEAYRHVLEGLQEMNEQDVPFQKYIVLCEQNVEAPRYLNAGVQYDINCLISKKEKVIPTMNKINILNPRAWPSKETLGLDESQIEAVRLALTKELAIIQGPPGTGKTYVGLKIAQALLTNTSAWQINDRSYPILVVCYTNHALDQFLEGIHQFLGKGIVRVGGRSSSEVLKEFNLRELRGRHDIRKRLPFHIRRACGEVITSMKVSEQKLQEGAQILQCSTSGIIREQFLQKYIKDKHWDSLHKVMNEDDFFIVTGRGKASIILEWLGLGVSPFMQAADPTGAEAQAEPDEAEEEEPEEDRLIEIQEEADIIQDERVLDDEDEDEARRHRKRKSKTEDNTVSQLLHALTLENKEPQDTGEDEEGWQMSGKQKKRRKQRVKNELRKLDAMTEAEAEQVTDLWRLDLNMRWRLYRHWIQLYQLDIRQKILTHEQTYQELADRLVELRQRQDLQILQQADVIGMTTTGAAKYRRILQEVEPRIVIVEEAAEVLEAHTITTLSSACQHLILIGDHQQLRPSANVYDLAKNFNLEVSLFERLINSNLPYVRLNYQHRMRPEIARLLTPHIYNELENHPSVLSYENIKGVSTNMFFVEHEYPEQEIKDGKSHQNPHEAEFAVELCKYFLHQEYKPSQITILTTYTGQLFCLRKLMPAKTFSGVKVHVVDKYQGEENDIIILSLVRSNKARKVGFLKISNRICVALSRAKKGLYCIGNMNMLSSVNLWSNILCTLRQGGQVGDHLTLCCQNHPEKRTLVRRGRDFKDVPEGGCNQSCDVRLDCGHVCTRMCHPYDQEHKEYQCIKDCQKVLCDNGHRCKRKCFEPCGRCMEKVEKLMPNCGHVQMVPCSTPVDKFCCSMLCNKLLLCGHPCEKSCGEDCDQRCNKPITVKLKCGHSQHSKCWQRRDIEMGMPVKCREPCRVMLSCGHKCPGTCDTCFQGRFHESCRHACKALLICSHNCNEPCITECPPCNRPCQNRCVHSQCKKRCGESCVPCIEPCNWMCQHYACTKLCSEPCDRPPCDVPCTKKLKCGHPCIGLCGEPCPQKCLVCHKDEVTEIFFGFEDENDARFVQLEDCGHIFETKGMDTHMEENNNSQKETAIKLKVCPKCQTTIRKNLRYGTAINRTLDEIEKVKERIIGPVDQRAATRSRLKRTLEQMVEVRRTFYDEYSTLQESLENPDTSLRKLSTIENMMLFYKRLAKLFINISKVDERGEQTSLKDRLLEIKKWLEKSRVFFTEQELSDLQSEVQRFTYLLELLVRCKENMGRITPEIRRELENLRDILEGNKKFTEESEIFVKGKLKELKRILPHLGLGITESERVMIVQTMGLQKGHWFKCPNNHVYCITECGGAMERSRCPECHAAIGGENHNLESTNRLAPEMDGAQHAAWSDIANNLINFEDLI